MGKESPRFVAILIILDTVWKYRWRVSTGGALSVAILIILDTVWKQSRLRKRGG